MYAEACIQTDKVKHIDRTMFQTYSRGLGPHVSFTIMINLTVASTMASVINMRY